MYAMMLLIDCGGHYSCQRTLGCWQVARAVLGRRRQSLPAPIGTTGRQSADAVLGRDTQCGFVRLSVRSFVHQNGPIYIEYRPNCANSGGMYDCCALHCRFLPRDALHKGGLCRHAVSICLSVCHVRVLCRNKRIVSSNFFPPSGSHTILVFPCQTLWQYSDEDPPNGGGASNVFG